jgi:hypothetical protein
MQIRKLRLIAWHCDFLNSDAIKSLQIESANPNPLVDFYMAIFTTRIVPAEL